MDVHSYFSNLNIVIDLDQNKPTIVVEFQNRKYELLNIYVAVPILPTNILNYYLHHLLKNFYEEPFDEMKYICVNKYIPKWHEAFYNTYDTLKYLIEQTNEKDPKTVCHNLIMYCGRNSNNFFRPDLVENFECVKIFILKYRLFNNKELQDQFLLHANKMLNISFTNYSTETIDTLFEYYFTDCPFDPFM